MRILELYKEQEEKFNKIITYFIKNPNKDFNEFQNKFKYYEQQFINAEYRYEIIEIVKKIYSNDQNLVDLKVLIDEYDKGMLELKNELLANIKNSTYKKDIEANNEKIFELFAKIIYPNKSVKLLSKEQRDNILNKINDPEKVIFLLERLSNKPEYKNELLEIYNLNKQNQVYSELIRVEDNILHQIYFEIDKTPVEDINLQLFIEILNESLDAYKELQNNQEINISYKTHGIQKNRSIPYEIPESKFFHLVGLPNCDFNSDNSNILGEFVKIYYELLKDNPNFIYNNNIETVEVLSQLINDYGFELLSAIYNDMNIWIDNGDIYSNDNTKLILSKNDPKIDSSHNIECDSVLSEFLINLLVDDNGNKIIVNGAKVEDIQKIWNKKRDEFISLYAPKSISKGHQNLGKSLEKCIRYRHISQFSNLKKIVLDYSTPTSKGWGGDFVSFTTALTPESSEKILYFDFSFITPLDPKEKQIFIEETIKYENGERKIKKSNFNPMYRNFILKICDQFGCKTFDDLYSLSVITPKDLTNNMIFDKYGKPNFDPSKINESFVLELCKKFNYRTFDDLSAFPIVICKEKKASSDIAFKQVYNIYYGAVTFSKLMSSPNNFKTFVDFFTDDRNKKIKEILSSKNLTRLVAEYFATYMDYIEKNAPIDIKFFKILEQLCYFKNNFKEDDFENYDKLCRASDFFNECYNKKIIELRSGKEQGKIDYYLLGYKYVDPLLLKKLLGSELPIIYNSDEQYRYSNKSQSIRSDLPISTILLDYDKNELSKKVNEEQKYAFRAFLLLAYTIAHEVLEKETEMVVNQKQKEFIATDLEIDFEFKKLLEEEKKQIDFDKLSEKEKKKLYGKVKAAACQNVNGRLSIQKEKLTEEIREQILSEFKDKYIVDNLPEPFKNILDNIDKQNLNQIDFLEFEKLSLYSGIDIVDGKAPRYISYESLYEMVKLFIFLEIKLNSNELEEISKSISGTKKTHLFATDNKIRDKIIETLALDDLRIIGKELIGRDLYVYNNLICIRDNLPISLLIPISRMLQAADSKMKSKSFEEEVAVFCYSEDIPLNDDYEEDSKESYELYVKSFMNKNFTQLLYDITTNGYSYDIDSITYMTSGRMRISRLHNIFDKNKRYSLNYNRTTKDFNEGYSDDSRYISDDIRRNSFDIIFDKIMKKIPLDILPEFYEYLSCIYDLNIEYSKQKYKAYENSLRCLKQKISNDKHLIEILDECSVLFYKYMIDLYDYEDIAEFRYLNSEFEQLNNDEEFGDDNITPDENIGKRI